MVLEDFHAKLNKLLSVATLDYETTQDCSNTLNRITVNLRLYEKFSSIWDSFQVKDKSLTMTCASQIKKLAWLIYIVVKNKVICQNKSREDITEIVFLMYAVLLRVLLNLPDEVFSEFLQNESVLTSVREAIQKSLQKQLNMPPGTDQEKIVERILEDFLMKVSFNSQITDFSLQLKENFLLSVNHRPTPKMRLSSYIFIRRLDVRHGMKVPTIVMI